jgi:hypothetical protein
LRALYVFGQSWTSGVAADAGRRSTRVALDDGEGRARAVLLESFTVRPDPRNDGALDRFVGPEEAPDRYDEELEREDDVVDRAEDDDVARLDEPVLDDVLPFPSTDEATTATRKAAKNTQRFMTTPQRVTE